MRGVDYATAKAALDRHFREIQRQYHPVAGAAVQDVVRRPGPGGEVFGIVVFLVDDSALPDTAQTIDGVPVIFQVHGKFTKRPGTEPSC